MAKSKADTALGMDEPISRRDFLNSTLLASGAVLLGPRSPWQMDHRSSILEAHRAVEQLLEQVVT